MGLTVLMTPLTVRFMKTLIIRSIAVFVTCALALVACKGDEKSPNPEPAKTKAGAKKGADEAKARPSTPCPPLEVKVDGRALKVGKGIAYMGKRYMDLARNMDHPPEKWAYGLRFKDGEDITCAQKLPDYYEGRFMISMDPNKSDTHVVFAKVHAKSGAFDVRQATDKVGEKVALCFPEAVRGESAEEGKQHTFEFKGLFEATYCGQR